MGAELGSLVEKALIKERRGECDDALDLLVRATDRDPDFADGYYHRGRILRQNDIDYQKAIELLSRACNLEDEPLKRAGYRRELGDAHGRLSQYEKAVNAYRDAIEELPSYALEQRVELYDRASRAFEKMEQVRESFKFHRLAKKFYRRGNGRQPADYFVRKALLLEKMGSYLRLVECFDRLLREDPDRIPIHREVVETREPKVQARFQKLLRGLNGLLEKDPEHAVALTLKGLILYVLARTKRAQKVLREAVKLDPDHFYGHHLLGKIAVKSRKYSRAKRHLLRALARHDGYRDLLRDIAEVAIRTGAEQEAVQAYRRMLELFPDDVRTYEELAELHEEAGRVEEAYWVYRALESRNGREFPAYDKLGSLAYALSRHDEALKYLNKAISAGGEDEILYLLRGKTFEGLERFERALEDYKRVLESSSHRRDIFWQEAMYRKADLLIRSMERYGEGLQTVDELLADDPELEPALILRGDALKGLKKFEESVSCYSEIVDQRISDALLEDASRLADEGQAEKALEKVIAAYERKPDSWEVYYSAATAYAQLDRPEQAVRYLDVAIRLNPNAVHFVARDQSFDPIRSDEGFRDCLNRERTEPPV